MTFAASETSRIRRARGAGFTLIEILVVVGIIVMLAAILTPMIFKALKSAKRIRAAADIQTIGVALDAYQHDFGDYPRFPPGGYSGSENPAPGTSYNVWGSQLLCWALIAPAPAVHSSPAPNDFDGADGPGFRLRAMPGPDGLLGTSDDLPTGKIHGPYLPADKFKLRIRTNMCEAEILDTYDRPILYYPARTPRPDIRTAAGYAGGYVPTPVPAGQVQPMYNATHNDTGNTISVAIFQSMLGDTNNNGRIDSSETEATTAPYILWTAGPDGLFGPTSATPTAQDFRKCDDVTNFNMGQ